ncbi:hypothetical protein AALP_AAs60715U000600 [Arabis alpina]|uniref:Uncharacterized protein n=1 Tax=Arabis alpina TaxID=50452 RepID=A0A087G2L9_ARAAL|nr:hypothetical protein AALP_AAs60715U000600 [Arabis alpina]
MVTWWLNDKRNESTKAGNSTQLQRSSNDDDLEAQPQAKLSITKLEAPEADDLNHRGTKLIVNEADDSEGFVDMERSRYDVSSARREADWRARWQNADTKNDDDSVSISGDGEIPTNDSATVTASCLDDGDLSGRRRAVWTTAS